MKGEKELTQINTYKVKKEAFSLSNEEKLLLERLRNRSPTHWLCPFCGKWHEWDAGSLAKYVSDDSFDWCVCDCPEDKDGECYLGFDENFSFGYKLFEGSCLGQFTNREPSKFFHALGIQLSTSSIIFKGSMELSEDYDVEKCLDCHHNCLLRNVEDDTLSFELGFRFDPNEFLDALASVSKKNNQKKAEEVNQAQKSENPKVQEKTKSTTTRRNKKNMAKLFNLDVEFGPNQDKNIASTLMGIAVKNDDSWRIYNKDKKKITDIGDLQLGNLPIFIVPTTKLSEGDLIKDGDEYYFVLKTTANSTQTLCARTGETKSIIPIKNVLGFSCYSKVIALDLSDSFGIDFGKDLNIEQLAILSCINQSNEDGEQPSSINQYLPLMLLSDNFGGDKGKDNDDMMKLVLMSSMLSTGSVDGEQQNANMNQILPFMLLTGDGKGEEHDDMMKLILVSSMMSSDVSGNPLMTYLMLDTFMKDKKDDDPKDLSK